MAAYTVFLAILLYLGIIAGLFVLFVYICGSICRSRGLPASYKWFGLLGVIGIIVVAVITPPYNPYYPPYTPPPPYQQPGPQGQPPYGPES